MVAGIQWFDKLAERTVCTCVDWSDSLDDQEIIERIVGGDEAAFEILYDRFAPLLYSICLRVVHNEHDAGDVLSEIFVEIWRRRASEYNSARGSVRSYLVTIARSRAIDRLRSTTTRAINLSKLRTGWFTNQKTRQEAGDQVRQFLLQEEIVDVRQAIAGLSDIQQTVLEMAYFDGMTHVEIAAQLDIPLGTVKTAIRRGVSTLRDLLIRDGEQL